MGSTQRFDYTGLGDGVNLASRLEGQSKPYGVKLILGPKTAEYVAFDYMLLELDSIAVKGKSEPVKIYTIAPHYNQMAQRQHEKFLDAYRKGVWKAAKFYSVDLKGKCWNGEMNKYYDMMLERMTGEVPENWDGIYRANSK
jgi:adenylate cyclase